MTCVCEMEGQFRCENIRQETRWSVLRRILRKYVLGSPQMDNRRFDSTHLCPASVLRLIPETPIPKRDWEEIHVTLARAELEKARALHERHVSMRA